MTPNIRKEVGRPIRLAKSHQVATGDRLGAILISIDLSILGADPDRYDAYASSIRKDFSRVPDDAYRSGRLKCYADLSIDRDLADASFAERYDLRARENMSREIALLS